MSDRNPNQDPDKGFPRDVPLIHGPLTPAEKEAQEERERREASDKSEQAFKDGQITATEAANRLSSRSIKISGITAFIAVLACIGTWYQGSENRKSWKTAQQTLDQMKADAAESAKQFQVQLGHFDVDWVEQGSWPLMRENRLLLLRMLPMLLLLPWEKSRERIELLSLCAMWRLRLGRRTAPSASL